MGRGTVTEYGRRATDLPFSGSWPKWFIRIWWIDIYFGHGRALEGFLIFVKLQYALMWLIVPVDTFIMAFQDIQIQREYFSLPFAAAVVPSLIGMILNARGFECSKWFRVAGATIGMSIWIFVLSKNVLVGTYASGINPWMLGGIVGSIWIIRRGILGLPRPGAPGAM